MLHTSSFKIHLLQYIKDIDIVSVKAHLLYTIQNCHSGIHCHTVYDCHTGWHMQLFAHNTIPIYLMTNVDMFKFDHMTNVYQ